MLTLHSRSYADPWAMIGTSSPNARKPRVPLVSASSVGAAQTEDRATRGNRAAAAKSPLASQTHSLDVAKHRVYLLLIHSCPNMPSGMRWPQ